MSKQTFLLGKKFKIIITKEIRNNFLVQGEDLFLKLLKKKCHKIKQLGLFFVQLIFSQFLNKIFNFFSHLFPRLRKRAERKQFIKCSDYVKNFFLNIENITTRVTYRRFINIIEILI